MYEVLSCGIGFRIFHKLLKIKIVRVSPPPSRNMMKKEPWQLLASAPGAQDWTNFFQIGKHCDLAKCSAKSDA